MDRCGCVVGSASLPTWGQDYELSQKYARAIAEALRLYGIDAQSHSDMD
jgi:hypothetical protein